MRLINKLAALVLAVFSLTSCNLLGINGTGTGGEGGGTGCGSSCQTQEIDLDAINEYFATDSEWKDLNRKGNKITLIPFTHINGPRDEWAFFAIVNFEYDALTYYKYQVTFLSCTCRSADVNYWQTMYVELTVPGSGLADDVKLRKVSFEKDNTGMYLAGFWGDSGIKDLEPEGINNTGIFYEDIRDDFIPYLVGQKYSYLKTLSVVEDIQASDFATKMEGHMFHDDHQVTIDDFSGASVSTNNLIRAINALIEYHAANKI